MIDDPILEFRLTDTTVASDTQREQTTRSPGGQYEAFTVDLIHLFIEEQRTHRVREMVLPLSWRPFAELIWINGQILIFDRWSQPHYAMHYAVNVTTAKLLAASAFPSPCAREYRLEPIHSQVDRTTTSGHLTMVEPASERYQRSAEHSERELSQTNLPEPVAHHRVRWGALFQ